ncbi:MAG: FkbM family methyltransferase [Kiloniellaceae bacterium]
MNHPPRAKLTGGVWLPEMEEHFVDWMHNSKRARTVEGKLTYQYHKLEAAMRHQPKQRRRVCLDIGAHVGLWAMWLQRYFEHVHAFEPVPLFADIFPYNVTVENCTLHRAALGNAEGEVEVTVPNGQTGGAHVSLDGDHPGNKYATEGKEVFCGLPMRTLDSFDLGNVDFIKIDVEGYELQVIRGGEATIRRWRPHFVIEQKGNDTAYGHPKDAAADLLKSWGWRDILVLAGDHIMRPPE